MSSALFLNKTARQLRLVFSNDLLPSADGSSGPPKSWHLNLNYFSPSERNLVHSPKAELSQSSGPKTRMGSLSQPTAALNSRQAPLGQSPRPQRPRQTPTARANQHGSKWRPRNKLRFITLRKIRSGIQTKVLRPL
jgi:hypothetical protein